MAELFFPDVSLVWSLQRLIGPGLLYHIFTNDHNVTLTDTLASFTEATYSGYAPINVAAAAWSMTSVTNHLGGIAAPTIAFFNISGSSYKAFGFFVTDTTGAQLVAASRFDDAPITVAPGAFVPVVPELGSYSGLEP